MRRDALISLAYATFMVFVVYGFLNGEFYIPDAGFVFIFLALAAAHFAVGYLIGRRRALLLAMFPFVISIPLHEDLPGLPSLTEVVAIFQLVIGLPLIAAGIGVRGALAAERRGEPATIPPRRP